VGGEASKSTEARHSDTETVTNTLNTATEGGVGSATDPKNRTGNLNGSASGRAAIPGKVNGDNGNGTGARDANGNLVKPGATRPTQE